MHVALNNLRKEDLKRIITEPKNSILNQYRTSLSLDGIKLTFTDAAIDAISQKAIDQKTGARGLRSIIENIMLDISYELPSRHDVKEVIVDENSVTLGERPQLITDRTPQLTK